MFIPGLKEAVVTNVEETGEIIRNYVKMERKAHRCPRCGKKTSKIHDYRVQKIHHLKWFERKTQFFLQM